MTRQINTVLFDLDGTLVDTAPDMAAALNALLQQHGQKPLSFEQIRNSVSKGSIALVKLGFGSELSESEIKALQQQFLNHYEAALYVDSTLFPGMDTLLKKLEQQNIPWGIVTNKPGWLSRPLLEQMQLDQRSACIVSGDDLPRRKPHPDPLLHACKLIKREPSQTVYVGDDERDIQAGRAAGMQTLTALYGYIEGHETPQDWGADGMINDINDLDLWLQQNNLY